MLKQLNFFHSQPSTLSKDALAKSCLSTTFGLSFMIRSVAPTRSSTFYAYLITNIENRNLKAEVKLLNNAGTTLFLLPTIFLFLFNKAEINNVLHKQCCAI